MKTRKNHSKQAKTCEFSVEGMHCAACEVLIEKELLKNKEIKAVKASTSKEKIEVTYTGKKPSLEKLNMTFQNGEYTFHDKNASLKDIEDGKPASFFTKNDAGELLINKSKLLEAFYILGVALLIILGFTVLSDSGLGALFSVSSNSNLPAFFVFGLVAGTSSCAALVGGIVLSMSKQWSELYDADSKMKQYEPHLMFNTGRLVSFFLLGGILGLIGGALKISLTFTSILTFGVSLMMIVLAFQMLGIKAFQRFQFKVPKFISSYIADEKNFQGRSMPAIMGALTFFLPCGFTITAQGLALASGSFLQGSLIMLSFALGTLPMLAIIGASSSQLVHNKNYADKFLKIAGVLVLFFGLYNINAQLNVLGVTSLSDLTTNEVANVSAVDGLPEVVNGKQVLKMDASSSGYSPNYLKVRAGVPVSWEITDKGTSGCTNAVISNSLFDGQIKLTQGETSVKEFTPETPGKYKFSCWMGMVTGIIEVVGDATISDVQLIDSGAEEVLPSGSGGCGCGEDSCGN